MTTLGLALDHTEEQPLYLQIFEALVARIRTGALPPGSRLPPTRQLAAELDAHRNTIVRAYDELRAAGFVHSTVGRGTFVAEHARTAARAAATAATSPAATGAALAPPELPWASLLAGRIDLDAFDQLRRVRRDPLPPDTINLARFQPPPELLPERQLQLCLDHVLRTFGKRALSYGPWEGVLRLRTALAKDLGRTGIAAHPDDVLVTTGSQQGLDLVIRALVQPGDVFLVDERTYSGVLSLLGLAGAQVVTVPSDAEGPSLAALRQLTRASAKGLYLMPNCANPTTATISEARRRELLDWSREAGVPLIEDDYAADLELGGPPAPPALRAMDGQVIHVGTLSKKLIPALRIGYLLAPRALRERLVFFKHAMDLGSSALLQHVAAELLERDYLRAHLSRLTPFYRERCDALCESLAAHLPDSVRWHRPERGVLLWLELPRDLPPDRAFEEARREGVVTTPSTLHGRTDLPARGGLRLCFCAEPPERLREAGRRLGAALHRLAGRRSLAADRLDSAIDGV